MKLLFRSMLLALPAVLAACGGGGDDKTCVSDLSNLQKTCVSHTVPEGIWYGAANNDLSVAAQTIVLETGQYFTVFTRQGSFSWMIEGTMTASNGAFSDQATVGAISNVIRAGSLSGNFSTKSTLAASTSLYVLPDTSATAFNGNYSTAYDTPLAISDVARTWTSASGVSPVATITVAADGTANGTAADARGTCAFAGSFKPRATGKHLLDGTLKFSGPACYLDNVSVAVEATVVNGLLTVVGVTPQRDAAFYLSAQ
ncbi:hypothetical protein [Caballeronia sp. RCC_10]|uniref:hypothetical protein n=1 Tax=Caballeronia sp. RCC_10 TaxID=3239227 RepID=UPI0035247733